jgi:hypothetical protein
LTERIEPKDIQSKLGEIANSFGLGMLGGPKRMSIKSIATLGSALAVAASFLLGKQKGKTRSTWVEVKRR